ncbi:MAG: hypothetical protein JWO08_2947 [Verrucomicrobiaceae bacterium]|nr:hypothetical protein [Verrucomicrobiaceae bacterium]
MKHIFRYHGLSIVLLLSFFGFWAGQAVVGHLEYNSDREERGLKALSVSEYLKSPHFLEATMENWESEFLQMAAYVLLTACLFQKGS